MQDDNNIVYIRDGNFEKEVLESELPVFVDFYADWCGPCKMVEPIIEKLAREYKGKVKFVKLNTDENQELAFQYNVMGIPTAIIFKKGSAVQRLVGAAPEQVYRRMLDSISKN
ncbi:MAG: thioredoxin [Conexivisphaerales archaeon]